MRDPVINRLSRSVKATRESKRRACGLAMKWSQGKPWPRGDRWKYPRPTFARCRGGPLDFVEIWDEDEFVRLGYPTAGHPPPHIPDFLGRTRSGEWVLYEAKSDDHLDLAVKQLRDGLRILRELGRAIDKLGIVLNRIQSNEEYFVTKSGSWLSHGGLMPGEDVIRLPPATGMPIMVELRDR